MNNKSKEESCCIVCKEEFSKKNVFTEEGWRETKISQMCEKCFDSITDKEDECLSDDEYNEMMDHIIQNTAFFDEQEGNKNEKK